MNISLCVKFIIKKNEIIFINQEIVNALSYLMQSSSLMTSGASKLIQNFVIH